MNDVQDTGIGTDLLAIVNAASKMTKDHIRNTEVLGVFGVKRTLGDLLSRLTG